MNEFYLIEERVAEVLRKIELYQELYGSKDSTSVLNSTFPECFSLIQESMFFEIVCRICAVFDPAETGGSKNLTIAHLVQESGSAYTDNIHLELESIRLDFKNSGLRKVRNKIYAHNDLNVYLKRTKFTTSVSYEFLKSLLLRVFKVVRKLGLASGRILRNQTIIRETKLPNRRNGTTLIDTLKNA